MFKFFLICVILVLPIGGKTIGQEPGKDCGNDASLPHIMMQVVFVERDLKSGSINVLDTPQVLVLDKKTAFLRVLDIGARQAIYLQVTPEIMAGEDAKVSIRAIPVIGPSMRQSAQDLMAGVPGAKVTFQHKDHTLTAQDGQTIVATTMKIS